MTHRAHAHCRGEGGKPAREAKMCNEILLSPKSARAVRAIKMDDKFTLDASQ